MKAVVQFTTLASFLDALNTVHEAMKWVYIGDAVIVTGGHGFERRAWFVCARCVVDPNTIWSVTIPIGQQQVMNGRVDEKIQVGLEQESERYSQHLTALLQEKVLLGVSVVGGLVHLPGVEQPLMAVMGDLSAASILNRNGAITA